jgi:hypothetical protein
MSDTSTLRHQLRAAGFCPIPLFGKLPPVFGKNNPRKGLAGWERLTEVTREQIDMWSKTWPAALNTGALTERMPTLDLDILNEDAVRAIESHARGRYEEHGHFLVRIGLPPKRAIPFRTEEPFDKILVNLIAPNGKPEKPEKVEFLCRGQQVVVAGNHPDTGLPYRWHGGEPGQIKLDELPCIHEAEAQQLVDEIVELLVRDFHYTRATERPKARRKGNGAARPTAWSGAADWQYLFDNIRNGHALHDSLRDLAAKLIASGMSAGAAVNQLRGLMETSAMHDTRWKERYCDIPRLVESAEQLIKGPSTPPSQQGPTRSIGDTLAVFKRWLLLEDQTPIYAVLGAIAANYLDGDPLWLGLIGPPSSAKTEILNSAAMLPNVVQAATITPAGLLSGTPRKQYQQGARGGLLKQIGEFGICVLKDFGSILAMHAESRAEVLAALREIYDGSWTRHVGSAGGLTLTWKGKLALVFAATGVIDAHYAVIGSMGDRFLFSRLAPASGQKQFDRALQHVGATTKQMRQELAEAVAQLFAGRKTKPQPITKDEAKRIGDAICLVVRLRGAVARDRYHRDIEAIYGAEGTARIGLALERLLAGLDTLGMDRKAALKVVVSVALDSVPPLRRKAYECVDKCRRDLLGEPVAIETTKVAVALGLPTVTTRRVLEELVAYGLIDRRSGGKGKADLWIRVKWEEEQPQ